MLSNLASHAAHVYSIRDRHSGVTSATAEVYSFAPDVGRARGEVRLRGGLRLTFSEYADYSEGKLYLYAYELYRGNARLSYWDPQPHPDDPSLASTHPHHQHLPPDLKRNRFPCDFVSFDQSNLDALVQWVVETFGLSDESAER